MTQMPPMSDNLRQLTSQTLNALTKRLVTQWLLPEKIATLDWMREEYYLPRESGSTYGPYNPDLVPHLWGILYALDAPSIHTVVVMKAAQVGWTFALIGYMGKRIDREPSGMLGLFPKEGDGRAFNDEKFAPTIKATPALSRKINLKTRKDGNRALYKSFVNGFIKIVGSNSPGNVKSTPAPVVFVEEPDDTSENVKDQGDAIELAKERLKRQRNSKLIIGGTPAVKGVSRVEEYTEQGTQRVLPVRCHDCGDLHVLDWEHVSWQEADETAIPHPVYGLQLPETAVYCCPHCGSIWDDWQRYQNTLNTAKAAKAAGDEFCGWVPTVENTGGIESFKELNELYAAGLPGITLVEVAQDDIKADNEAAKGDQSSRIVFINSKLGRPYEYDQGGPDLEEMDKRGEDYKELTAVGGGLVLVAGVDVQLAGRFAIRIWAMGYEEEAWLVYWGEISVDKAITDINDPAWKSLENLLFTPIEHKRGFKLHMSAVTIDSSDGQTSDQVYDWVKKQQRKGRKVMAGKGDSHDQGKREIFTKPRAIDTKGKNNTKSDRHGVQVYMVGTHKAKDLLIGEKGRYTLSGNGPGRRHWYKSVRDDFLAQTFSEIKAPNKKYRGKLTWQHKSGVPNEGCDCDVYALHASRSLHLHRKPLSWWEALEARLMQTDLFSTTEQPSSNASNHKTQSRADNARKLNG